MYVYTKLDDSELIIQRQYWTLCWVCISHICTQNKNSQDFLHQQYLLALDDACMNWFYRINKVEKSSLYYSIHWPNFFHQPSGYHFNDYLRYRANECNLMLITLKLWCCHLNKPKLFHMHHVNPHNYVSFLIYTTHFVNILFSFAAHSKPWNLNIPYIWHDHAARLPAGMDSLKAMLNSTMKW